MKWLELRKELHATKLKLKIAEAEIDALRKQRDYNRSNVGDVRGLKQINAVLERQLDDALAENERLGLLAQDFSNPGVAQLIQDNQLLKLQANEAISERKWIEQKLARLRTELAETLDWSE